MKDKVMYGLMAGLMVSVASAAFAQGQAGDQSQSPMQTQGGGEQIFGSQMMSAEERQEYRERMQSATTAEERERIRAEHHERMMDRAQEQGVTLPDMPPEHGQRMGPGGGMGPGEGRGPGGGMGSGGGMGPGGGRQ